MTTCPHCGGVIEVSTNEEERKEAATRIIEFYRTNIKTSDQTRSRGVKNVNKLLQKVSEKRLMKAMETYAAECDMEDTEPTYRKGVGNFFGNAADWEYYETLDLSFKPAGSEYDAAVAALEEDE